MDELDRSWEPMDIDRSLNSTRNSTSNYSKEIDENNTVSPNKSLPINVFSEPECLLTRNMRNVNKLHVNFTAKQKISRQRTILVVCCLVAFIASLTYHTSLKCSVGIDPILAEVLLSKKLHGQNNIRNDIISAFMPSSNSKIVFFYGGTGVGKTYATNLVIDNVLNYTNIYHYTMPSFKTSFSSELMVGLIMCKFSVVIVDGLTVNDLDIAPAINNIFTKSANLDTNVNIVLIYNTDVATDGFLRRSAERFDTKLMDIFASVDVSKHYVKFNSLKQKHLQMCIEDELHGKHKLTDINFNKLLKKFDVELDGCKGVNRRIRGLNLL